MQEGSSSIKSTAMVSLITAACLLGDSMLYVVLPVYWQYFGLEALWQVGVLLSVNRFARLPLNPLIVWLYGHLGRRQCVLLAIALALLTTFAYSYCQGFALLLLARTIWGFAWAILRLGAYFSILEFATATDRGHHMGVYNGVFRLGSLFGMLGGAVIAEFVHPLAAGYIFAGFSLLAIPLAVKYVPATVFKSEGQNLLDSVKIMFSEKLVTILVATSFLSAMVYQGIFNSMLSYLIGYNQLKLELLVALGFGAASFSGLLQTIRWLWELFLAPVIGKLSDGGRGRRWLLKNFCFVAAFLFLALSYKMNIYLWILLVMLVQVGGTGITTMADAVATDVATANKNAPAVLGAHSFCIDLGSALGPMLGYFFIDNGGIHAPFFLAGACLLTISLLWAGMQTKTVK